MSQSGNLLKFIVKPQQQQFQVKIHMSKCSPVTLREKTMLDICFDEAFATKNMVELT